MEPVPDHGERSNKGSGQLVGKKAIIMGGDSGIGRAVALAFAREGADLLISYLSEHEDAEETKRRIGNAGRKAILNTILIRLALRATIPRRFRTRVMIA